MGTGNRTLFSGWTTRLGSSLPRRPSARAVRHSFAQSRSSSALRALVTVTTVSASVWWSSSFSVYGAWPPFSKVIPAAPNSVLGTVSP